MCVQVVLQVVIAFIVEAFVLQLEQSNRMKEKMKKKILERHLSVVDDSDCVEGIYIIIIYIHILNQMEV